MNNVFALHQDIVPAAADSSGSPYEQHLNIAKGIEYMAGDRRLFVKHFNRFKNNNSDLALKLSDMIRQNRYEDAVFLCHSMTGLSGMLGMFALQRHMADLEAMITMENETSDTIPMHIMRQLAIINDDLHQICQTNIV